MHANGLGDVRTQVRPPRSHAITVAEPVQEDVTLEMQAIHLLIYLLKTSRNSFLSVFSVRSILSMLSLYSVGSFLSLLCLLSSVSATSLGSLLSIASVGSIGSVLSVGSIMSIGCVGGNWEICW